VGYFSATVDFYSIAIGNRIVGTGTAPCKSNGVVFSALVCNAIAANGNVLDPGVTSTGTTVFANGVSTLTHGVDITANYNSDFGGWGRVDWTGAANWGETSISSIAPNPPALAGVTLQTPGSLANLTSITNKFKFVVGASWNLDAWTVNLREIIYGPAVSYVSPGTGGTASLPVFFVVNGANYYQSKTATTGITDLDVNYAFTDHLSLMVGADNLLGRNAPVQPLQTNGGPIDNGSSYYDAKLYTPWGINGGFYYGRVKFTW